MGQNSTGYLVRLSNGILGRTYFNLPYVDGKVQVFKCVKSVMQSDGIPRATEFSKIRILCDEETTKVVGYIR